MADENSPEGAPCGRVVRSVSLYTKDAYDRAAERAEAAEAKLAELDELGELVQQTRDKLAAQRGDRPPVITPWVELPEVLKDSNRAIAAAVRDRVLEQFRADWESDSAEIGRLRAVLAEVWQTIETFIKVRGEYAHAGDLAEGLRQIRDREPFGNDSSGGGL
jgi:hypothetical protein